MYRLSPYTYLIEALLGQGGSLSFNCAFLNAKMHHAAIGRMEINCSPTELVTVDPPSGQTCGSFLQEYISRSGGYITNPDATIGCQYCSARTTDEWMEPNFNILYSNHWRDFGIFWGYIVFNVSHVIPATYIILNNTQTICVYVFTYLIRVQSHKRLIDFSKRSVSSVLGVFKVGKGDA